MKGGGGAGERLSVGRRHGGADDGQDFFDGGDVAEADGGSERDDGRRRETRGRGRAGAVGTMSEGACG